MRATEWGAVVVGLSSVLWPVAAQAVEPPPAAEPAELAARTTALHYVVLRVEGRAWTDVRDELAPRLPQLELLPFEDQTFDRIGSQPFAYVALVIEPGPKPEVELAIVLSDRRAYLRRFTPERAEELRSIATTVANTLAAIEQEALPADREAEIPRPEPEPEPEPSFEPEPSSEPLAAERPSPAPGAPEDPAAPPPFELGVTLAGQPIFGLAPPLVRGVAGLGGEARISARQRNGVLVELGIRVSGRERDGHRLWRSRLQLAVGYAWRSGAFGVAAVAGPTTEPWAVRSNGIAITPMPVGDARATPLWGAAAAITPGFYRRLSPTLTLRIAVRAELQASVLSSGAAARVLAPASTDAANEPAGPPRELFSLGGLEASTGLELTLWIAPPRSTATRTRERTR